MPDGKWFRIGYAVIILLVIIYLSTLVDFIFTPFFIIVQTLFPPIIIAGIFFYLCRPLVNRLDKRVPRAVSILLIFVLFLSLVASAVFILGPPLQEQVLELIDNTPNIIQDIQLRLEAISENEWLVRLQGERDFSLDNISAYISENMSELLTTIGSNLLNVAVFLTNIIIIIVVVPFVLFYLLKDGAKLPGTILEQIPKKHRDEGKSILHDMDEAISSYIQGQVFVSICVGVLAFVAYLIIGLEYALLLALFAMLTNVIPVIGPFIGTFPAVIVGFIDSPLTALWVVIAILIVQQIESNLISPQVMGRQLRVHPLTIILLLLVASQIAGLIGLILAVPTYALLKVMVQHIRRLIRLKYSEPEIAQHTPTS